MVDKGIDGELGIAAIFGDKPGPKALSTRMRASGVWTYRNLLRPNSGTCFAQCAATLAKLVMPHNSSVSQSGRKYTILTRGIKFLELARFD